MNLAIKRYLNLAIKVAEQQEAWFMGPSPAQDEEERAMNMERAKDAKQRVKELKVMVNTTADRTGGPTT